MAGPVRRLLALLRAPLNELHFRLRRLLRWSRGVPALLDEPKDHLFDYLPPAERPAAEAREASLRARYDLSPLHGRSTRLVYRDNLYLVDALEAVTRDADAPGPGPLRALDVGSQSFTYAFGLHRFLTRWGTEAPRPVHLRGVELDGWVLLRDLRSRRDHALAHVASTGSPTVSYAVGDVLDVAERELDVVTLFYPFLTRYALLQWGLPLRFLAPERIVAHALSLLRPGGLLIVFNQTDVERDVLLHLVRAEDGDILRSEPIASRLVAYRDLAADRHATVVRRR